MQYDVVILGAGAAGLMCAARAGQRGRKVLVLDKAGKAGAKILLSGGGRCNFTNIHVAADRYISQNPAFCISALKTFGPRDFVALIEKHKIPYHEKTLGQLFCNNASQDIVDMLLDECRAGNVDFRFHQKIQNVEKDDHFRVQTQDGTVEAPALVLATGGLSVPKMGASGFTHDVAHHFGIPVTERRPALVPLVFDGAMLDFCRTLSGLSLEVIASCGKAKFRESMIFTHRGLSGPAILQVSSYWREGQNITLDLLPDLDAEKFLIEKKKTRPKAELRTILSEVLPQRLAQSLTAAHFVSAPMATYPDKKLKGIAAFLKNWTLTPTSTEGYGKAEITLGGVDTKALSSKTMESQAVAGLYIVGEALDVTGWLGGYNLHWAWASGWAAGTALK